MGMLWCLKMSYLVLGILLLLLLVQSSDSNLEVKDDLEHNSPSLTNNNGAASANEQNVGSKTVSDPKIVAPFKKEEQVEKPKEDIKNDLLKSSTSNTLESKDGVETISDDSSKLGFTDKDKENVNVGFDSKKVIVKDKENGSTGGSSERDNSKQVIDNDKEVGGNTGGSEEGDISKQVVNKDKESGYTMRGSRRDNSKQVTNQDQESSHTSDSKGLGSKQVREEDGNKESFYSSNVAKEKLWDDECDPSNMCIDEKKSFIACLKVPGNDSPDLSLQIRNRGTKPVTISITAPAFVQLEERKVALQPKEDKKVKVTIAYDGTDSLIFLTTKDTRCTLNFRELVPHDARVETRYAFKLRYLNNWNKTHLIIFLTLTVFLVFGCAWMYFGLHKKLVLGNGYQAVEVELPVSNVTKAVPEESSGGWDDSWDDSWGDEEAPMTPTLPATPNLSSRGLASRRLGKEGWKD